ncbi:uncharacterized protein LOC109594868 isoform X2 [Aethina tumida]|uniref:uncharacterized protein LOC109594868 isoform X2 n=1 Tax=Aethina tumida TaxID=116153 RepID=UPI00214913E4|nr:uncharacterized protein LOC109594868 isoform X2 [Aethina tumida]
MDKNNTIVKLEPKSCYFIQTSYRNRHPFKGLRTLLQQRLLVDIAVTCGSSTMHAHKSILASSSPLFREEFERNASIEQVVVKGCDFSVVQAIIDIIYSGETTVTPENLRYLAGLAKTLRMDKLTSIFNIWNRGSTEVNIPKPQFLTKRVKYFSQSNIGEILPSPLLMVKSQPDEIDYKTRRKNINNEAEKACVKEAHASRMALAHLQKEIEAAPLVNSFIIEETCTETTVENFIPNELQIMDYSNFNSMYVHDPYIGGKKPTNIMQLPNTQNLGEDIRSSLELLYRNDGSILALDKKNLQNFPKNCLSYQIVDENSNQIDDMQRVQILNNCQTSPAVSNFIENSHDLNLDYDATPDSPTLQIVTSDSMDDSEVLTEDNVNDGNVTFASTGFPNTQFILHNSTEFEVNTGSDDKSGYELTGSDMYMPTLTYTQSSESQNSSNYTFISSSSDDVPFSPDMFFSDNS